TDTRSKEAGVEFSAFGVTHHLGGMAKGSGMIHPDMATLLAFLTTDAAVPASALRELLARVVGHTFNRISVDGDTSTNDCCLLLASGAAGSPPLTPGTAGWGEFEEALDAVLGSLAEQVVADGEGATRVFEVQVSGAASPDDALLAARCVSSSPLVKTAVHGGDPNWGRVLAAVGRSGAELALDRCRLSMQGEELFSRGQVVPGAVERVAPRLLAERVVIEVNLGVGEAGASALGCDLSADYVRINADYST
ncbi:MAG: bifunctional ornithine acetyltransferase/N-acetylglutamate synthase, partial [Candidatus Dormibacteria bacterium]